MIETPVGSVLALTTLALTTRQLQKLPPDAGGDLWRLTGIARQLDANLVRLTPGEQVADHVESELDVLINVVGGSGVLKSAGNAEDLAPGHVLWLPRGVHRGISAGADGLVYLSVHRRRAGLAVSALANDRPDVTQGGEAPCMIARLCPHCDRPAAERDARFCAGCGGQLLP